MTRLEAAQLALVIGSGALPALVELNLSSNNIGDQGMIALADAFGKGALAQLQLLDLRCNKVGDVGLSSLANALGKGALPALVDIHLSVGATDATLAKKAPALKAVCVKRGIILH